MRIGDIVEGQIVTVEPCFDWPLGRWQPLSEGFMELEARGIEWTPRYPGAAPRGFESRQVDLPAGIRVNGYETAGDGGGGLYQLVADPDPSLDDGGTVLLAMPTDRSMINDMPGIVAGAARAAAQPPVAPPAPLPERVAPAGVSKAFGFDHRMGSGGTHGHE